MNLGLLAKENHDVYRGGLICVLPGNWMEILPRQVLSLSGVPTLLLRLNRVRQTSLFMSYIINKFLIWTFYHLVREQEFNELQRIWLNSPIFLIWAPWRPKYLTLFPKFKNIGCSSIMVKQTALSIVIMLFSTSPHRRLIMVTWPIFYGILIHKVVFLVPGIVFIITPFCSINSTSLGMFSSGHLHGNPDSLKPVGIRKISKSFKLETGSPQGAAGPLKLPLEEGFYWAHSYIDFLISIERYN